MSVTSPHEHEIPTAWSQKKAVRLNDRFLKGPIPLRHISAAAKLHGQALSTFLAIHHQVALTRREWVTLPKGLLDQLGVSRDAKARALQHLEATALIQVTRATGRTARVRLVQDQPLSSESAASSDTARVIWRNESWNLTAAGLSSRQHQYQIAVSQLTETREVTGCGAVAMWPLHMAEKSWVNIDGFIEAYEKALMHFKPVGCEAIELNESFVQARVISMRRRTALCHRLSDDEGVK